jgi:hypothetical protein
VPWPSPQSSGAKGILTDFPNFRPKFGQ